MTKLRLDKGDWQRGGLMGIGNRLYRPVNSGMILVPNYIELDGNKLLWGFYDSKRLRDLPDSDVPFEGPGLEDPEIWVEPGPEMVDGFVKLSDAPTEEILRYARRWGVLGICEHLLPSTHHPTAMYFDRGMGTFWKANDGCFPLGWPLKPRDPIKVWRRLSLEARTLLDMASKLQQDKLPSREDWGIVSRRPKSSSSPYHDLEVDRNGIAYIVDTWLQWGNVRPRFHWNGGVSKITLESDGMDCCSLFGALAIQLVLAISRTEGLAICSSCGESYIPSRRPRPNQRSYCQRCGRREAQRDAAADYRRRKKSKDLNSSR